MSLFETLQFLLLNILLLRVDLSEGGAPKRSADVYDLFSKGGFYCAPLDDVPPQLTKECCYKFLGSIKAFYSWFPDYGIWIELEFAPGFETHLITAMDLGYGSVTVPTAPIGRFRKLALPCDDNNLVKSTIPMSETEEEICSGSDNQLLKRKVYAGHKRVLDSNAGPAESVTFFWNLNYDIYGTGYNTTLQPSSVYFLFNFINTKDHKICGPYESPPFKITMEPISARKHNQPFSVESSGPMACPKRSSLIVEHPEDSALITFSLFPSSEYKTQETLSEIRLSEGFEADAQYKFFGEMYQGGTSYKWDKPTLLLSDYESSLQSLNKCVERPKSIIPEVTNPDTFLQIPNIYQGCLDTKGCYGETMRCRKKHDCSMFLTWTAWPTYYEFELQAKLPKGYGYVAMGLSLDTQMGDDLVVECLKMPNGEVGVFQSWNLRSENTRIQQSKCDADSENVQGLHKCKVAAFNGTLYCKFQRQQSIRRNSIKFDILENRLFLQLAHGSSLKEDGNKGIGYHEGSFVSEFIVDFNKVKQKNPRVKREKLIHTILMILTWIVFVPNGKFFARYYKETLTRQMCIDRGYWFVFHVVALMIGFVLATSGVILLLVASSQFDFNIWPKTESHKVHTILGTICLSFYLVEVISGWYKPSGHGGRKLFGIIHSVIGNVTHFMALYVIATSYDQGMDCNVYLIVIAASIWQFIWHAIMTYHFYWLDSSLELINYRALSIMPIKQVLHEDAPGSKQRLRIGVINFIGSVVFAGILIAVYLNLSGCPCTSAFCKSESKYGVKLRSRDRVSKDNNPKSYSE